MQEQLVWLSDVQEEEDDDVSSFSDEGEVYRSMRIVQGALKRIGCAVPYIDLNRIPRMEDSVGKSSGHSCDEVRLRRASRKLAAAMAEDTSTALETNQLLTNPLLWRRADVETANRADWLFLEDAGQRRAKAPYLPAEEILAITPRQMAHRHPDRRIPNSRLYR
ncbi:hypothetical protein GNI_008890 [Gregarina niphandrodes]|uniref:Uncharacterized protein n=1 Tax=Gregarina niphandrodes TaxID=110365 RepID=A0A023BD94_GRENI|nr:hypothetical protein GNI_008890 [Gregarina niphandrodes]EZG86955.1 hypothetical protein GNI_008890 [Gregarina niphandrodes]|eukprot:XP_011128730.1 hypothetical protein GNI_008890 [Gregarina niphandrodes]